MNSNFFTGGAVMFDENITNITNITNLFQVSEYIDLKCVVHKVKHSLISVYDANELKERITQDLYRVFNRK